MIRLAAFKEGTDLYRYLSGIASKTIYDALCEWVESPADIEEICDSNFSLLSEQSPNGKYFDGLARHLRLSPSNMSAGLKSADIQFYGWYSEWDIPPAYSEDENAAIRFLWMKIERIKEKMIDQKTFYTLDLFEEFLFSMLIEQAAFLKEAEEISLNYGAGTPDHAEIIKRRKAKESAIETTRSALINRFRFEDEGAESTAKAVHCVEKMGFYDDDNIEDSNIFFWDDDYRLFFECNGTFIDGIRKIMSGVGSMLGYGYQDAAAIFTDAGYALPLSLLGTETAYDIWKEDAMKRMQKMQESLWLKENSPSIPDKDNELPFS